MDVEESFHDLDVGGGVIGQNVCAGTIRHRQRSEGKDEAWSAGVLANGGVRSGEVALSLFPEGGVGDGFGEDAALAEASEHFADVLESALPMLTTLPGPWSS